MKEYGDTDIFNLFNVFQEPLEARSVEFVSCQVNLKEHISRKRKHQKNANQNKAQLKQTPKAQTKEHADCYLHFFEMWAIILSDTDLYERFKDILQIVKIVLVLPVHTAAVERGFSQMSLVISEKRNCMSSDSLRSLLRIKLSQIDFRTYDPTGAIIRWAPLSDQRKRRT